MRIIWVSVVIVVFDQITKLMVKGIIIPSLNIYFEGIAVGSSRPIWGNFLRLTYIENPGMAFGIDIGGKLFFSIFTLIASIGIFVYLFKMRNESFPFRFSLAMILGGACGNLIDRLFYGMLFDDSPLFYGKVVDFIDMDFFNVNIFGYHLSRWPVFNIADASVSVGVILLLFVHRRATHPQVSPSSTQLISDGASGNETPQRLAVLPDQELDPPQSSSQP